MFAGNTGRAIGTRAPAWHNRPHARIRSTTCGTSPRRLQACLQRLLSARFHPVAQLRPPRISGDSPSRISAR
ncbi:hypothetical protein V6679_06995 [Nocardia testacea]